MSTPEPASVRVLICDDDQVLSAAMATLIQYTPGMLLVGPPVRSGPSAIDAVRRLHPDVVLMDVELIGEMDGFEATKIIRDLAPTTNVVIMSGMADVAWASDSARAAGAHDFLPKAEIIGRVLDMLRTAAVQPEGRGEPC